MIKILRMALVDLAVIVWLVKILTQNKKVPQELKSIVRGVGASL
jgi:hypothetical protein